MTLRISMIIACLLAGSAAIADAELEQLATLLDGKFDTHAAQPELASDKRLVDRRLRISAPQLGPVVFYQQINHGAGLEVYRQRILVVARVGGAIEQQAYAFKEPQRYVDADRDVFESLSMDDLEAFMPDGCEQVWTATADGFRGYVDPKRCVIISSRTGKERQIEAENVVNRDSISTVERGYDPETGEQLFGSPQGESLLLGRVGDDG